MTTRTIIVSLALIIMSLAGAGLCACRSERDRVVELWRWFGA